MSVALEDVRFAHPSGPEMRFDVTVEAGALALVTGPSGSGKSTLLDLIAGFAEPRSGHVMIAGDEWTGTEPGERPVTMIFQEHNLFAHLDARTNVALGIAPRRRIRTVDRERADGALARVGLAGKGDRLPGALSGGERQRVALARALLRDKPVLLLDEPFAALGPALQDEMLELVAGIRAEKGATVLLVTHQPEAAVRAASDVLFLADGRVHLRGGPDVLHADDPAVRSYLGTQ